MSRIEEQLTQALRDTAEFAPELDTEQLMAFATSSTTAGGRSSLKSRRWIVPVLAAACVAMVAVIVPIVATAREGTEQSATTAPVTAPECPPRWFTMPGPPPLQLSIEPVPSAASGGVTRTTIGVRSESNRALLVGTVVYVIESPEGVWASKVLSIDQVVESYTELPLVIDLVDCEGADLPAGVYQLRVLVTVGPSHTEPEKVIFRVT